MKYSFCMGAAPRVLCKVLVIGFCICFFDEDWLSIAGSTKKASNSLCHVLKSGPALCARDQTTDMQTTVAAGRLLALARGFAHAPRSCAPT